MQGDIGKPRGHQAISKDRLNHKNFLRRGISEIKLKRTDTTLDLSHCNIVSMINCFDEHSVCQLTKAKRAKEKNIKMGTGGGIYRLVLR